MKTVQMTLDENVVRDVDRIARKLKTTRSAFTRDALKQAVQRQRILELETKHQAGYRNKPPVPEEFSIWESEQKWGD